MGLWVPTVAINYLISRGALLGTPRQAREHRCSRFLCLQPNPADPASRPVCLSKLGRYVVEFDAKTAGYDLPVPFFVIQGRDDTRRPPEAAHAFLSQVRAPAKGFTAIDGGHFACFTNPAGFLDALDGDIRGLRIR